MGGSAGQGIVLCCLSHFVLAFFGVKPLRQNQKWHTSSISCQQLRTVASPSKFPLEMAATEPASLAVPPSALLAPHFARFVVACKCVPPPGEQERWFHKQIRGVSAGSAPSVAGTAAWAHIVHRPRLGSLF